MEQILQVISRPEVWIPVLVVLVVLIGGGGIYAHRRNQITPPVSKPQLPPERAESTPTAEGDTSPASGGGEEKSVEVEPSPKEEAIVRPRGAWRSSVPGWLIREN